MEIDSKKKGYSYLKASIGNNFAALQAGQIPKIKPTRTEKVKASMIENGEMKTRRDR